VIGGIDAYLYHTGDEFSKASSRTGTCMTHVIIHVTLFMSQNSKQQWDKDIIYVIYKFAQIYL
jgi:hypothetical protein